MKWKQKRQTCIHTHVHTHIDAYSIRGISIIVILGAEGEQKRNGYYRLL